MTDAATIIETMNQRRPAILHTLNGAVIALDVEAGLCTMQFDIDLSLCHSGNIVQGGIVTAMLDAASSHAVFGQARDITALATLEIKTSFLEPSLAGRFTCEGRVRKMSYKLGFMDAELFDDAGKLTATASTTVKILRSKD